MILRSLSSFFVPQEVVPQQRPRATSFAGHAHVYDLPKCSEFRNLVRMITSQAWKNPPLEKNVPLMVRAVFILAIPKSASARRRKLMIDGMILPTRKPDVDNAAKGILDGATGIIWQDDSQIQCLSCGKFFGETPGTFVNVYQIINYNKEDMTFLVRNVNKEKDDENC